MSGIFRLAAKRRRTPSPVWKSYVVDLSSCSFTRVPVLITDTVVHALHGRKSTRSMGENEHSVRQSFPKSTHGLVVQTTKVEQLFPKSAATHANHAPFQICTLCFTNHAFSYKFSNNDLSRMPLKLSSSPLHPPSLAPTSSSHPAPWRSRPPPFSSPHPHSLQRNWVGKQPRNWVGKQPQFSGATTTHSLGQELVHHDRRIRPINCTSLSTARRTQP